MCGSGGVQCNHATDCVLKIPPIIRKTTHPPQFFTEKYEWLLKCMWCVKSCIPVEMQSWRQLQETVCLAPVKIKSLSKKKKKKKKQWESFPIRQPCAARWSSQRSSPCCSRPHPTPCPSPGTPLCPDRASVHMYAQGFLHEIAPNPRKWSQGDLRKWAPCGIPLDPYGTLGHNPCPHTVHRGCVVTQSSALFCSNVAVAGLHFPSGFSSFLSPSLDSFLEEKKNEKQQKKWSEVKQLVKNMLILLRHHMHWACKRGRVVRGRGLKTRSDVTASKIKLQGHI